MKKGREMIVKNRKLPKSAIKTIRYIKYDAPDEKLPLLEKELAKAMKQRKASRLDKEGMC